MKDEGSSCCFESQETFIYMRCRQILCIWLVLLGCLLGSEGETTHAQDSWPWEWELPSGVTYQLRGRIDSDAIWATQSEKNEADFGPLGDVVGLRRARIGLQGDLPGDRSYIGEIDLASGDVVIRDLFVAWPGCFEGQARFGHYREPFSLEGGTSARYFAFMERSPANTLDPARNWGLGLFQVQPTEISEFAAGLFYGGPDSNDFEGGPGSTAGITAKLTAAPINEEGGRYLLHVGGAVAERLPLDGVIRVNEKPRSPLLEFGDSSTSSFTPTLMIPADFQHIMNAQLAISHGSFWSQAEWYGTIIDQSDGGAIFYQGNYVDVGYFLTGEHREYESEYGELGKVTVHRPFLCGPSARGRMLGPGAWEVAVRIAWLDFIDPDTPTTPGGQLQGIQLTQATLGLNWYLTDRLRMMFNYTYAEPSEPNVGQSTAHVFGTRLGFFW